MKKRIFVLALCALAAFTFSACGDDEERITEWPGDAFDFMEGVPQFFGEQYKAVISEDFETVSIYYKEATLEQTYAYIEQLKAFGLEENVSTPVKDGKFHWISEMKNGELFAEVMWYDMDFEPESGEYIYSLVLKFAEF
ncbi:MAG: hypothetical protein E7614_04680 [Ruminococcaceae bacterium]|nr:hypothetical protein [Oscillospiraceae bacterium]